jgi:hypothetical protein
MGLKQPAAALMALYLSKGRLQFVARCDLDGAMARIAR